MSDKASRVLAVCVLLLLSIPALAVAQSAGSPPRTVRERTREMLSGVEDVPSADAWRRVGPSVIPVLMGLYNDQGEAFFIRARAVSALGAFAVPEVRTFLVGVADADGQGDLMIGYAVTALGTAFGRDAIDDLRRYLAHDEPVVREAAARQLGALGTAEAQRSLRARLAAEPLPHVRETIQRALRVASTTTPTGPTPTTPTGPRDGRVR
ncbi:MAG: HEAT repeat domain-containing protein [Sandaracinaceae bacterium]